MKKYKYIIISVLVTILLVGSLFVYRHQKASNDMDRLHTAYSELLSERKGIDQAALACQEATLERSSNFPAILKGKSVDQIKTLILQQPATC